MQKTTVLIVSSPSLSRVIRHLFRGRPEYEVVGAVSGLGSLGPRAEHLPPALIVANVKPVSIQICEVVAFFKRYSPISKLILICPVEDLSRAARKCGADACLNDENLASQLIRTARTLTERRRLASAGD